MPPICEKRLTAQGYYNRVCDALIAGKLPAAITLSDASRDTTCCYRTDDGRACMAGLAIPDDVYGTGMEGMTFDALPQHVIDKSTPEGLTPGLIRQLQHLHDHLHTNAKLKGKDFAAALFVGMNAILLNVPSICRTPPDSFMYRLNAQFPKETPQCPGTSNG